ncbi:MAG TPA: hypothetical protein VI078_11085 [bacterium]
MGSFRKLLGIACVGIVLLPVLPACVVYKTASGSYSVAPGTPFDRSWSAALGAFADEQVVVIAQDRGAGTIRGTAGDLVATAKIQQLSDGNVRVEFDVNGNQAASSYLKERILGSYSRRMER